MARKAAMYALAYHVSATTLQCGGRRCVLRHGEVVGSVAGHPQRQPELAERNFSRTETSLLMNDHLLVR